MVILGLTGLAGSGKDTAAQLISSNRLVFPNSNGTSDNLYILGLNYPFSEPLRANTKHIAFADPIKVAAHAWWDFSVEQLWGPSKNRDAPDERYRRDYSSHEKRFVAKDWMEPSVDYCIRCVATRPSPLIIGNKAWPGECHDFLTPREALQFIGTEVGRTLWSETWANIGTKKAVEQTDELEVDIVVISDVRFPNEVEAIRRVGGKIWRIEREGSGLSEKAAGHASELFISSLEVDRTILNNKTIDDLKEKVSKALEEEGW